MNRSCKTCAWCPRGVCEQSVPLETTGDIGLWCRLWTAVRGWTS